MKDTRLLEGFKTILDGSNTLTSWSLTIIAGTILTIISTSYFRPVNLRIRSIYLLFIPGWICILISCYQNNLISRRFMAAVFTRNNGIVLKIAGQVNIAFSEQLKYFKIGILFFSIWLVLFLLWWIYGELEVSKS